ncbi:putative PAS/PAC sensor protein [Planoprotostelium fungivorum]|uniref:Putative PAS/PAC sensor protein n=1 Tax=Planoprotostelium fungivorum TaxID=1890364 RepID=A0A2P6N7M3_9EUKA|nr:putative PAS/PAC sensor protein [Planoprotostelium fungivorum]
MKSILLCILFLWHFAKSDFVVHVNATADLGVVITSNLQQHDDLTFILSEGIFFVGMTVDGTGKSLNLVGQGDGTAIQGCFNLTSFQIIVLTNLSVLGGPSCTVLQINSSDVILNSVTSRGPFSTISYRSEQPRTLTANYMTIDQGITKRLPGIIQMFGRVSIVFNRVKSVSAGVLLYNNGSGDIIIRHSTFYSQRDPSNDLSMIILMRNSSILLYNSSFSGTSSFLNAKRQNSPATNLSTRIIGCTFSSIDSVSSIIILSSVVDTIVMTNNSFRNINTQSHTIFINGSYNQLNLKNLTVHNSSVAGWDNWMTLNDPPALFGLKYQLELEDVYVEGLSANTNFFSSDKASLGQVTIHDIIMTRSTAGLLYLSTTRSCSLQNISLTHLIHLNDSITIASTHDALTLSDLFIYNDTKFSGSSVSLRYTTSKGITLSNLWFDRSQTDFGSAALAITDTKSDDIVLRNITTRGCVGTSLAGAIRMTNTKGNVSVDGYTSIDDNIVSEDSNEISSAVMQIQVTGYTITLHDINVTWSQNFKSATSAVRISGQINYLNISRFFISASTDVYIPGLSLDTTMGQQITMEDVRVERVKGISITGYWMSGVQITNVELSQCRQGLDFYCNTPKVQIYNVTAVSVSSSPVFYFDERAYIDDIEMCEITATSCYSPIGAVAYFEHSTTVPEPKISLDAVTAEGCQALIGTAVYVYVPSALVYVNSSRFIGGVSDGSGTILIESARVLQITSSTFQGNSHGNGGAVTSFRCPNIYISDSLFLNNQAGLYGGALKVSYRESVGGAIHLGNTTFYGNNATMGGAIYVTDVDTNGGITIEARDVDLQMSNCSLSHNMAEMGGGAVFLRVSRAELRDSRFRENYSNQDGGALLVLEADVVVLRDNELSNNVASDSGSVIKCKMTQGDLVMEENVMERNVARNGDVLDITGAVADVYSRSNQFGSNMATVGAIIHLQGTLNVTIHSDHYLDNQVSRGVLSVRATSSRMNFTGLIGERNSAAMNGSVISAELTASTLLISESNLNQNEAVQNGGAVYLNGVSSSIKLRDVSLSANSADSGGSIYIEDGGALYIKWRRQGEKRSAMSIPLLFSSNFADNSAKNGGAIYTDGDVQISECHLWGNTATYLGASVYVNNGTLNSTQSSFSKDHIYLSPGSQLTSDITITDLIDCPTGHTTRSQNTTVTCVDSPKDTITKKIVIVAVVVAAVLLLTFIFIMFLRFKKRALERYHQVEAETSDDLYPLLLRNVVVKGVIDSGNFGKVYRGTWDATTVALKGVSPDKTNDSKWKAEIVLLKNLNHPNIVRFLGVILHDEQYLMVLEYVDEGSLKDYLRKQQRSLTDNDLIFMCFDVVKGMLYLQGKGIVHRDLAARNILVDRSKRCKISDFGMSRIQSEYEAKSDLLPYRWSAPEAIQQRKTSYESDVWSFGVLAWEIFSFGLVPYWELGTNQDVIRHVVEEKRTLGRPHRCPEELFAIFSKCWMYEAEKRPRFIDIHSSMTSLYEMLTPEEIHGTMGPDAGGMESLFIQADFIGIQILHEQKDGIAVVRSGRLHRFIHAGRACYLVLLREQTLGDRARNCERPCGLNNYVVIPPHQLHHQLCLGSLKGVPVELGVMDETDATIRFPADAFAFDCESGTTIYQTSTSIIQRAFSKALPGSVIVKTATGSSEKMLMKYEREIEIGAQLRDLPGVLTYHAMDKSTSIPSLISEDFGAQSLAALLEKNEEYSMIETIRLSVSIVECVRQKGYVHQLVCPEHILVNRSANLVKLCDLSYSSLLQKQNQVVINPRQFLRYLEYISPEQTGRMNKDVDFRTDYYTIGVVMYRLCTGVNPFQSDEPSKLIYSLIAKNADPPCNKNAQVPKTLSNIIMKLLSKNADDRYQSAFGLRSDLERCLADITEGIPREFQIGSCDVRSRFQLSQKLYGRENEMKALLDVFESVATNKEHNRLAIVSGFSGIGKTSLINELHKPLTKSGGHLISGKIDQYAKNIPYSCVCQAFQQLLRKLLTENVEVIQYWKDTLLKGLSGKGQLVIDVIPEVELIIGPQQPLIPLGPSENQNRFKAVFKEFIKVFARPEHPLVIFLDDLQWADIPTLSLFQELMTNDDISHLMMIGAYRDNEVNESSPLIITLKAIESCREITEIRLTGLTHQHITQLIADSFQRSSSDVIELSQMVSVKTQGNPFFINAFLNNLVDNDHIRFDSSAGKWVWESFQNLKSINDDVLQLMTERLYKLQQNTRDILSLAAAIGNRFDMMTLSALADCSIDLAADYLWPAIKDELILMFGDEGSMAFSNPILRRNAADARFQFSHDKVQQASYELTALEDRPKIHLKIGRALLKIVPSEQLDERLFDIMAHFGIAKDLIQDEEEKLQLAHLWVKTAERAKHSNAIQPAYEYISIASSMMPRDSWTTHYELMLSIYKILVEAEYLRGEGERAKQLYPVIMSNCKNREDKASIYAILRSQLELDQKYNDALDSIAECLKMYDVHLPSRTISSQQRIERLKSLTEETETILAGRTCSELYKLKDMTEKGQETVLYFLISAWAAGYITGVKEYLAIVSAMAFNWTLRHGLCKYSSAAFCNWAFSAMEYETEPQFAFEVAVLGCHVLESHPNEELRCRCYFPFGVGTNQLVRRLSDAFPLLDKGFNSALEVGNVPYACYLSHHMVTHRYLRGSNLDEAMDIYRRVIPFLERHSRVIWYYGMGMTIPLRYHIRDDSMPTDQLLSLEKEHLKMNKGAIYVGQLQTQMWRNNREYNDVFELLDKAFENLDGVTGFYSEVEFFFCAAMIILRAKQARYFEVISEERADFYLNRQKEYVEIFEKISQTCPSNNAHKLCLLRAEMARSEGKSLEAILYYKEAKASASSYGFLQYEALSSELLGQLWITLGQKDYAKNHLEESFRLYREWGSSAKLAQMTEDYPGYISVLSTGFELKMNSSKGNHSSIIAQSKTRRSPVVQSSGSSDVLKLSLGIDKNKPMQTPPPMARDKAYDLDSTIDMQIMIKISESTSADMSLEKLLDTTMRLLIENAAAQRGIFLLQENNGDLLVVAEGDIERMNVDSLRAVSLHSMSNYPHNIINYVARTKETVIIGDRKGAQSFESSQWLQNNDTKSILCMPIINNNRFKGVIYLDNNLINNAFNDQRAKVVGIIAVQMAMHLDNAKFSHLLESEKRHRALATELAVVKKGLEEFIDVLCHELRNPLNGIYGSKQLMSDQVSHLREYLTLNRIDDEAQEKILHKVDELGEMLDAISVSSDHLKDIVDTVLTASMIEKKGIKLQDVVFKPADIIDKVGLMYKAKLMERGLTYTPEISDPELQAIGDPQRLSQALINIISNSVKFMHKGGLTVSCHHEMMEADQVKLIFTVKDTGIGMTEQEMSKLFQPFSQANSTIFSKYGGSGLGLKITKEIIEMMGGTIGITSQKGVGSSCFFNVTCRVPPFESTKRKRPSFANQLQTSSSSSSPQRNEIEERPAKRSNVTKKILIVEDNMINQKLLKKILESQGYSTELADNGQEAFDKARSVYASGRSFYAILMDFEMPIMNGVEATKKIREFEQQQKCDPTLIIGVSANARETHMQTAKAIGMNVYITKPFQKNDIFDAIENTPRLARMIE